MPSTASRRPVAAAAGGGGFSSSSGGGGAGAAGAAAAARRRSEIFVDVIEKLSAVLSGDGRLLHASLEGFIQMKSYLDSPPLLKLALTDQLPVAANGVGLCAERCTFQEGVDFSAFESERLLLFKPPAGEFVLMNYRIKNINVMPFRVFPLVEELAHSKAE
ncbi:hypothetical protein, conserved, partial [Eimeria acervulina]